MVDKLTYQKMTPAERTAHNRRRKKAEKEAPGTRYREQKAREAAKWRKKNPDKTKAHSAVQWAITSGKLIRKPCAVCGQKSPVEQHHNDYKKRLDVVSLCPEHHRIIHTDFDGHFDGNTLEILLEK